MTDSKTLATATLEELALEVERRLDEAEKETMTTGVRVWKDAPSRRAAVLFLFAKALKLLALALLHVGGKIMFRLGFPDASQSG